MADDLSATLATWRASPTSETAIELCRAIAAGVGDSAGHRARLAEVGPLLIASHAADGEVMLALGALYLRGGELFLADAVLKRVLAATPDDPRVWRLLGEVFLRAGNARDAVTAFDGAAARGMTDAATAAWRERAQSYVPMQDGHGSNAVAASIAGATTTVAQAPQPAHAAAPTPAAGAPHPESARTAVLYVPDHGPAEPSPDSARTLVYQGGPPVRAQPARVAPGDGAGASAAAAAPEAAPAATVTAPPPTPHTPRMPGGAPAAPTADTAPSGNGGASERSSMRGAVSEGRDILDEISMSIHILRLDKAGMPQSERDMDRYLERLRASQGLVIDEPTRVDDRAQAGPTPVDGVPTFQPVTGASTLPMTSVRDVLRELEQAGPASAPSASAFSATPHAAGMAPPAQPMPQPLAQQQRPAAGGSLPKVVVQAPPAPQPALPAPAFAPPPAASLGTPHTPGFAPQGGMAMQPLHQPAPAPVPMVLASRRPPKKSSATTMVVLLLVALALAAGGVLVYLRFGAQLRP